MATRAEYDIRPRSRFRADIQGLRAIAVLAVIASHAGLPFLKGGYVGVDLFFVVSGFLISTLLFGEVGRSGTLSLSGFYARRARRILPAATVVTLATMAASVLLLSLVEARLVARDALWATAFGANIHFAAVGTDYFAQNEPASPLQHYWSLSVEEQFYLAWPLVLLLIVWAVRRAVPEVDARRAVVRRAVLPVLLAICAASLGYSTLHTASDPTAAYFSPFTRAFELGVGGVTALVVPWFSRRATDRFRTLLLVVGLVGVAVCCVAFTSRTPFPGVAALLPVLSATALILAGTAPSPTLSHRLLGMPPLRVVGDWSYSLYLWHWPVLIIGRRLGGGDLSPLQTALALVLVFALAGVTYRLVETPFRSGHRLTIPWALLLYPVSLGLALSGFAASNAVTAWELGREHHPPITLADFGVAHPDRYQLGDDADLALVHASVVAARHHMAVPSDLKPPLLDLLNDVPDAQDCDYALSLTSLCPRGDLAADRTIVVVGDSHGRMWIPAFDAIGARAGWKVYYLVKPHCTAALVSVDHFSDGQYWSDCDDFHTWTHDQIAALRPDLVVVATTVGQTLFADDSPVTGVRDATHLAGAGFENLFRSLQPLTRRLVLMRDIPQIIGDPATCLTTGGNDLGDCLFPLNARSRAMADQSVAAAGRVGIQVVDPTPWVCWDGSCPVVVGSTITYRDRNHLSGVYAGTLSTRLEAALELGTP